MQDVDAKRSASRSGPRSHETHAVLTDNRTDSLRRGDDSHVGRLRSNKAHTTPRFALDHKDPRRGEAGTSLRPAYYLACKHDVVIFDNKACRLAALGTNPLARWVGRMESVPTSPLRFTARRFADTVYGHL